MNLVATLTVAAANSPVFTVPEGEWNITAMIIAICAGSAVGIFLQTLIPNGGGLFAGLFGAVAVSLGLLELMGGGYHSNAVEALAGWLSQHYPELNLAPQAETLEALHPAVSPADGSSYQMVETAEDTYTLVEITAVPVD